MSGDPLRKQAWFYTWHGDRLHYVGDVDADALWNSAINDGGGVEAFTACDRFRALYAPGVVSRLAMPRCKRCCEVAGIPDGKGAPINDPACNPAAKKEKEG